MAPPDTGDDAVGEEADHVDRDGAKEQPASRDDQEDDQHARHVELRPFEPFPVRERPARDEEDRGAHSRSEEHTSELQSLMRHSYAVLCLTKTHTLIL